MSGDEAERRGIIYDRKFLSFLFDLNSEWVIDAARLGNNSRFINHSESERDGLNCEAKITLVNGEHRIKFIAMRDLKAGEELLFNYGKKFAEKHGLSKKLPKGKGTGGAKGALVEGDEALEDLDGLSQVRGVRGARGGREKGTLTAGPGRTRGRKARKSAKVIHIEKMVVDSDFEEADEDLDDDDDSDEMDEGDLDLDHGRRKRKITRPARYTR